MSTTQLQNLLSGSGLGDDAVSVMELTADTFGPAIRAGLGTVALDDIDTSEVVLVTLLIDDSGSIRFASNSDAVKSGHNEVLVALKASKASGEVLVSCRYLNGGVLYPYVTLDNAVEMTNSNYNPTGGTPLYDMMAVMLSTVTAKVAEFEQGGVAVRAVSYVITDGADEHSRTNNAQSVNKIVKGLLRTESHIVGGVGITDGYTNFERVFDEMGIPREWVLTPGNNPTEIRRAFGTVSRSAVRASQAAGTFSQTALGGFGN